MKKWLLRELHALSVSESCIRFAADKSSVTLLTDPAFLAKNQLSEKGSRFMGFNLVSW
jgi:hypothetical protein